MVDKELIDNIINNELNSDELASHENIGTNVLNQTLTSKDILTKYLLSSHLLTKLKNIEPNQKIIDAYDIDWDGYEVSIRGKQFKPKTTFEMFDLIFRLIKQLYGYHGSDYVEWNDSGVIRTDNNQLYWYASKNTDHKENYGEISNIYSNDNDVWNDDNENA